MVIYESRLLSWPLLCILSFYDITVVVELHNSSLLRTQQGEIMGGKIPRIYALDITQQNCFLFDEIALIVMHAGLHMETGTLY